jgi:transposase InsO family protein
VRAKTNTYSTHFECLASTAQILHQKKKIKQDHLSTITLGWIHALRGSQKSSDLKRLRILFDTGCAATLINTKFLGNLKTKKVKSTKWTTKSGSFSTNKKCNCTFILPEFHDGRDITWTCYVDETDNRLSRYDMIIGRDLLTELGINFLFDEGIMTWDNASVPMRNPDWFDAHNIEAFEQSIWKEIFSTDPDTTESERIQEILDHKYSKADLEKVAKESTHLPHAEQQALLKLLKKYETLFDGTLGNWKMDKYNIELREDATPYHAKPYPVPHSQEQKLREEVARLEKLNVLRKINRSEWGSPMFTIPKKDGTLRSIADFRELNKRIKRKPFPIPKIQDMLLKLEGFKYATSLDLNMGYYHIELTPFAASLCTVVLPWGKYEYTRLPMGLCNSPDIFQEKMSELMVGLEFARAYIDDLLVISNGNFGDHLDKLEQVLSRLLEAGLKVNVPKSFFGREELEYLGYWITRDGVKPLNKKVEAINNLAAPTNRKELRRFIGLINYYRDMWIRRSEVLAPLTALTSIKVKWKWTEVEQNAFDTMKRLLARETILSFPDFAKPFHIHTDASKIQLGAVISQEDKPIAFYSRKLSPAQTRYTTTERELLSIVEVLKEFRNILLGQDLIVHTDHMDLTFKKFNSDRVMRWRLFIEEYSPNLTYVKGEDNIVADALSRLEIASEPMPEEHFTEELRSELYSLNMESFETEEYPLSYKAIGTAQAADISLTTEIKKKNSKFKFQSFHGGGSQRELICYKNKIVIPALQQKQIIDWYHHHLGHPGVNRTDETISQHLWWKGMRKQITTNVTTCAVCQLNKRRSKKFGHMPEKEAEAIPWDKMCIDLIGPYKIRRKGHKPLVCRCVTMIDPATGWFEICQYDDKRSITVANIAEQEWFSRYPWPSQITYDRGSEFIGHEFQDMIVNDYGIKRKPITVRNPQANAIVERIHQVIGNIIRTFELQTNYLDEDDPWKGILSATAFAVRSTYHTTLQKTPGQLVFGRDMIFNTKHTANWEYIRERKQSRIKANNKRENAKRTPHTYHQGDRVVLAKGTEYKYEQPYSGPHTIEQVFNNGTVRLRVGAVSSTVNIRRIEPFK